MINKVSIVLSYRSWKVIEGMLGFDEIFDAIGKRILAPRDGRVEHGDRATIAGEYER